eukprot:615271-Pelagomonas_calceolata.AAC.1
MRDSPKWSFVLPGYSVTVCRDGGEAGISNVVFVKGIFKAGRSPTNLANITCILASGKGISAEPIFQVAWAAIKLYIVLVNVQVKGLAFYCGAFAIPGLLEQCVGLRGLIGE